MGAGAAILLGLSGLRITLTDQSLNDSGAGGSSATYQLNTDGTVSYFTTNSGSGTIEDYCLPTTRAGELEVQVTVVGNAVTGSTTGSYIALTSNRNWTLSQVGTGIKSSTLTVTVRQVAAPSNSKTITLTLDVDVV